MDQELENAIVRVYDGPLEDFIHRRDALVKELRAAGQRESASILKSLRKPSRTAWALNLAAQERRASIDVLVAALADATDAQAAGGDVRAAIGSVRTAVRDFAAETVRAAEQAGQSLDAAVVSNAVLAVIGDQESFTQLRRGTLADVPEAGGLDLLTTLTAASAPRAQEKTVASASGHKSARDHAASAAAKQARVIAERARERWVLSQRALRDAESKLQAADARLRQAEEEVRVAHSLRDRAHEEADAAAAELREAEDAAAVAEQLVRESL